MKKAKELYLLETPKGLQKEISIDIIRLLSRLNDKDAIVVIVDLSQISYSLVVILELNSVSEVQYKDVIITDDEKYQQE